MKGGTGRLPGRDVCRDDFVPPLGLSYKQPLSLDIVGIFSIFFRLILFLCLLLTYKGDENYSF